MNWEGKLCLGECGKVYEVDYAYCNKCAQAMIDRGEITEHDDIILLKYVDALLTPDVFWKELNEVTDTDRHG